MNDHSFYAVLPCTKHALMLLHPLFLRRQQLKAHKVLHSAHKKKVTQRCHIVLGGGAMAMEGSGSLSLSLFLCVFFLADIMVE